MGLYTELYDATIWVILSALSIHLQVNSDSLDLLEHPLVGSLLHYKWWKFGMWVYVLNLLLYLPFLVSLTIFALLVLTPESKACKWFVFTSMTSSTEYVHAYVACANIRIRYSYPKSVITWGPDTSGGICSCFYTTIVRGFEKRAHFVENTKIWQFSTYHKLKTPRALRFSLGL